MNQTKRAPGGYTLIEMLTVIAIIGIVVPALYLTIISLYRTHSVTLNKSFSLVEATKGVKEIVRDVRAAVYADDGSLPIVSLATSSLVIYADTDLDGKVERVRYFLDNGILKKGIVEPTATSSYPTGTESVSTLSVGIVNTAATPMFRYYTSTSTEIVTPSASLNVRRVEVKLIARTRNRSDSDVTLSSSASIRNLKDSY